MERLKNKKKLKTFCQEIFSHLIQIKKNPMDNKGACCPSCGSIRIKLITIDFEYHNWKKFWCLNCGDVFIKYNKEME